MGSPALPNSKTPLLYSADSYLTNSQCTLKNSTLLTAWDVAWRKGRCERHYSPLWKASPSCCKIQSKLPTQPWAEFKKQTSLTPSYKYCYNFRKCCTEIPERGTSCLISYFGHVISILGRYVNSDASLVNCLLGWACWTMMAQLLHDLVQQEFP